MMPLFLVATEWMVGWSEFVALRESPNACRWDPAHASRGRPAIHSIWNIHEHSTKMTTLGAVSIVHLVQDHKDTFLNTGQPGSITGMFNENTAVGKWDPQNKELPKDHRLPHAQTTSAPRKRLSQHETNNMIYTRLTNPHESSPQPLLPPGVLEPRFVHTKQVLTSEVCYVRLGSLRSKCPRWSVALPCSAECCAKNGLRNNHMGRPTSLLDLSQPQEPSGSIPSEWFMIRMVQPLEVAATLI